jgi:Pyridoxamine 5'-phosphate oxidase
MTTTSRNLDGYEAPEIEWARVRAVLDSQLTQAPATGGPDRHTWWLTTINPDGSPHVMAVGVVTYQGNPYFISGPGTRKARNLARDPRCVFSVATHPFDLVLEGTAARVTDEALLRAIADAYRTAGWPAEVDGDALTAEYMAPSGGPPPWHVYRMTPASVFALGTSEPGGATKFDLA